jgi:hypothetical protein
MEFELAAPPVGRRAAAARGAAPTLYRVRRTNQVDEYDERLSLADAARAATARRAAGNSFKGKSRKAAKISIAAAPIEDFDDLKALIESLPDEALMTDHDPPITTKSNSNRVAEEKRNVRVQAFLYAASREDDNDFHLIIGRAPHLSEMYMTVEISGLPPPSSPHRSKLESARAAYKSFFEGHSLGLPGTSYDFYDPPIPVQVSGSLFFDMSHVHGGRPGPEDLRDDIPTIWEIHPVTRIVFEP